MIQRIVLIMINVCPSTPIPAQIATGNRADFNCTSVLITNSDQSPTTNAIVNTLTTDSTSKPTSNDTNGTSPSSTEMVDMLLIGRAITSLHDDIIDTAHVENLLIMFLYKIGWTNNALHLLASLHITTLQAITSIPLWKIDYWITICHPLTTYLFQDLRVLNLMIVLREPHFHPFYLPWILEHEWNVAYETYCYCSKKLIRWYTHLVRLRKLQLSCPTARSSKSRLKRPLKNSLHRPSLCSKTYRIRNPQQPKHQFISLHLPHDITNESSPSYDPFLEYYGSVQDILTQYDASTINLTPDEIYIQNQQFLTNTRICSNFYLATTMTLILTQNTLLTTMTHHPHPHTFLLTIMACRLHSLKYQPSEPCLIIVCSFHESALLTILFIL